MFSLKSLVHLDKKAIARRHSTDSYVSERKFCAALTKLDKEMVLYQWDKAILEERLENLICSYIYYEDLTPEEEREAFLAKTKALGLELRLYRLRYERYFIV